MKVNGTSRTSGLAPWGPALAAGTYTDTTTVSAPGIKNSPLKVPVTLNIGA